MPQKKGPRKKERQPKKGFKTPRALKIALPVGLVLGGAALYHFRPTTQSQLGEVLSRDRRHESLTSTGIAGAHLTRPPFIVFEGAAGVCARCHDLNSLGSELSQRLRAQNEEIRRVFPARTRASIDDALVYYVVKREAAHEPLGTVDSGTKEINLRTSAAAKPEIADIASLHELVHYTVSDADHRAQEVWASVAPYMARPQLLFSKNRLTSGFTLTNRFVVHYLQWAERLSGRRPPEYYKPVKGAGGLNMDPKSLLSSFHRQAKPGELAGINGVYRRAFENYASNSVFWDAVINQLHDSQIIPDTHIALELQQRGDPGIMKALSDEVGRRAAQSLIQGEIKNPRISSKDIDEQAHHTDLRFAFQSVLKTNGYTEEEANNLYLAGLLQTFTQNGTVNTSSVPIALQRQVAEKKEQYLNDLTRKTEAVSDSLRQHATQAQGAEREIASRRASLILKRTQGINERVRELRQFRQTR